MTSQEAALPLAMERLDLPNMISRVVEKATVVMAKKTVIIIEA